MKIALNAKKDRLIRSKRREKTRKALKIKVFPKYLNYSHSPFKKWLKRNV